MRAIGGLGSSPRSMSSDATNRRTPSCTCGAASPTPWYSAIVSIMSSISLCIASDVTVALSSAFALARSTG